MRLFKPLTLILIIMCLFGVTVFVKSAFASHMTYKAWTRACTPGVGCSSVGCESAVQAGNFCLFPKDTNLPDETGTIHNLYTDNNVFVFRKPNDSRPWVHQHLTAVDGYHSWSRICPMYPDGGFVTSQCGPGPNAGGFSSSGRSSDEFRTTNNLVFIFYDSSNQPKVGQHISSYDGKSARARVCKYNPSNSGFSDCTAFVSITSPTLSVPGGQTYDAYTDNYVIPVRKSNGTWEANQGLISYDGKHSWVRTCGFNNDSGDLVNCPGFTYFGVSPTLNDDHGNSFNRYTDNVNYYDSSVGGSSTGFQSLVALPVCNADSANPVCSGNTATQCTNGTKNCYYDLYEGSPNCIQPSTPHPVATSATGCASPNVCTNGSCLVPTPTPTPIPSTPTPTDVLTPVPFACDFNSNRVYDDSSNLSDNSDFSLWRKRFLNISGSVLADCTGDGLSNLADFNKWYRLKYSLGS